MDVSRFRGTMSEETLRYSKMCQTPCILRSSGKVFTTQKLRPSPPVSLVPRYVMALFYKTFPEVQVPPADIWNREKPTTLTPQELSLLRRYGLVRG